MMSPTPETAVPARRGPGRWLSRLTGWTGFRRAEPANGQGNLHQRLIERLSAGVVRLDTHANVVETNDAAIRILATARDRGAAFGEWNGGVDALPIALRQWVTTSLDAATGDWHEVADSLRVAESNLDVTMIACGCDEGFASILHINERELSASGCKRSDVSLDAEFRRLYESTPAVMHSVDHNGKLLSVSDRWLQVLGYSREDVIGRSTHEIMSPDTITRLPDVLKNYFENGFIENVPYTYFHCDGTPKEFLVSSVAQRDLSGKIFRSNTVMQEVNELRKLQSELAELNAFRSLLFQQAVNGIIMTDIRGHILTCNDEACRILDIQMFTIIGNLLSETFSTPECEQHFVREWIESDIETDRDASEVLIAPTSGARQARINIKMTRHMRKGSVFLVFFIFDVSEMVRIRIELDRWKTLVEESLAIIEDGFMIFDGNDRLMLLNDAALKIFELEKTAIATGDSLDRISEAFRDSGILGSGEEVSEVADKLAGRFRDTSPSHEVQLANGRWIRIATRPMSAGGKVTITTDITKLKTLLDESASQNRILSRVNSDLENYLRLASHDLKSPLRSILAGIQFARQDVTDGRLDEACTILATIERHATSSQTLLEDMQTFARVGQREESSSEVEIEDLVAQIADTLDTREKALEIVVDDKVRRIRTPASSLSRVLENVMRNAIMHNPAACARVRVECRPGTGTFIEFVVKDNGPGIPIANFENVFDPLFKLPGQAHSCGSGMGLAIARRHVELRGGRIWLEMPAPEEGTIVRIDWPASGQERDVGHSPTAAPVSDRLPQPPASVDCRSGHGDSRDSASR
ncbi:MAG: PAS domain S-box protein [Geminicoccaceae bacterium]